MITRTFRDNNNRLIELRASDPASEITAYYEGEEIGSFCFKSVEDDSSDYLLVTNMYLNKQRGFLRCGIGTAILNWAEEEAGCSVVFGQDDGNTRDDGAHLTEDGPAFAAAFNRNRQNALGK